MTRNMVRKFKEDDRKPVVELYSQYGEEEKGLYRMLESQLLFELTLTTKPLCFCLIVKNVLHSLARQKNRLFPSALQASIRSPDIGFVPIWRHASSPSWIPTSHRYYRSASDCSDHHLSVWALFRNRVIHSKGPNLV